MPLPHGERLLSIRKVAELLDVDPKTVRRMWQREELPAPRQIRGGLRWFASDIDYYLETLRRAQPPAPKTRKKGSSGARNSGTGRD